MDTFQVMKKIAGSNVEVFLKKSTKTAKAPDAKAAAQAAPKSLSEMFDAKKVSSIYLKCLY